MSIVKLNETPVRTARNFQINNISIDAPKIPEKIDEFKNVKIETQSTNCEKTVDNTKFIYGIGEKQEEEISKLANSKIYLDINKKDDIKIIYTFDDKNRYLINNITLKINKDANIIIEYRTNTENECYHNGKIKVIAENNANAKITIVNFLNIKSTHLEAVENDIKDNAEVKYTVMDIGGKYSITNYYSNLIGANSKNEINTIYLGVKDQVKDINYISDLRGVNTRMKMELQGALKDESKKNFKGSIDFKKGSKKAKGNENESCMLLSDKAKSIALPMLLCTEEDVDGQHSTSSGKADEKELFYIMSRGLSRKEAIKLIVKAKFYKLIEKIQDEDLKTEVVNEIDKKLD